MSSTPLTAPETRKRSPSHRHNSQSPERTACIGRSWEYNGLLVDCYCDETEKPGYTFVVTGLESWVDLDQVGASKLERQRHPKVKTGNEAKQFTRPATLPRYFEEILHNMTYNTEATSSEPGEANITNDPRSWSGSSPLVTKAARSTP